MELKCSSENDLYIARFTELTFTEANMVEFLVQVGGKTPDITKRPSIREFYFSQGSFDDYGDFTDSVVTLKNDCKKLARFVANFEHWKKTGAVRRPLIEKHGKN